MGCSLSPYHVTAFCFHLLPHYNALNHLASCYNLDTCLYHLSVLFSLLVCSLDDHDLLLAFLVPVRACTLAMVLPLAYRTSVCIYALFSMMTTCTSLIKKRKYSVQSLLPSPRCIRLSFTGCLIYSPKPWLLYWMGCAWGICTHHKAVLLR